MMLNKTHTALLTTIGILFVVLYCILSWNNRFPYEDYTFIAMTKVSGPVNAMMELYDTYSARWSAHTAAFCFSRYFQNNYFLFVFNIISLLTLVTSFYLLLKKISEDLIAFNSSTFLLILYSILFTACLFFSSYSIGETWFWYMVNWMYLWSLIAGNTLLWVLLSGKINLFRASLSVIVTAYIAGAAESYAMICIAVLAALFYIKKKNIFPAFSGRMDARVLLLSLLSLAIFYSFTLVAPGTWERKDMLTDASVTEHFIMTLKAYGIIILYKTPPIMPYLILLSVPWMLLGQLKPTEKKMDIKKIFGRLVNITGITGLLIFVLIFPASWILYDVPPSRALSQVSLLLSVFFSWMFYYLGSTCNMTSRAVQSIAAIASVLSVFVIGYHAIDQHTVTSRYAKAYDERIGSLLKEISSERKNVVRFEPLPPSGMLYSDELSKDSLLNNFFEAAYGLKFHTAVK